MTETTFKKFISRITVSLGETAEKATSTVDILRAGTFFDMFGREVIVTGELLDRMVVNFDDGVAKQDVPVDIDHRFAEAAGWVKSLKRDGDHLFAEVEWNELGKQLIGDKVYKYLSSSLSLAAGVLRAVSLVNFPAVKGLSPVELGECRFTQDSLISLREEVGDVLRPAAEDDPVDLGESSDSDAEAAPAEGSPVEDEVLAEEEEANEPAEAEEEELPDNDPAPEPDPPAEETDMSEETTNHGVDIQKLRADLRAEVEADVELAYQQLEQDRQSIVSAALAEARRNREIYTFSLDVTTQGNGIPATPDELTTMLSAMPDESRKAVQALLRKINQFGLVDFNEQGTEEEAEIKTLGEDHKESLRLFLEGGGDVKTYFEANPELGSPSEYAGLEVN